METTTVSPNAPVSAATEQSAVPSLDSIAAKMAAMRERTERNLLRQQAEQTATGQEESADSSGPVATDSDTTDAEIADTSDTEFVSDNLDADAQNSVSTDSPNSTADELIDFIEFANENPNAKFKFVRNGKEVVIDAKKAAAILGQGSAIHEEARQLKVERAEFDEYVKDTRQRADSLLLAMEFTVQPKLQKAYNEIMKVQGYQATFQQQLARTQDPAEQARIQASMAQNEQYLRQQQKTINRLKPAVEQFRQIRAQQVSEALTHSRKNFQDKELKNEYVYNEVRDKLAKVWPYARMENIPGITNIDLLSSDETIMGLIRDGLRYRDKPTAKSAGASMAALTQRKGSSPGKGPDDNIAKLREQANRGDKKAADNLLMAQLQKIRAGRGSR